MARDCLVQSTPGKDTVQSYTLDSLKTKANTNLVIGMCFMKNQLFFVLVESRVTHSFISCNVLGLKLFFFLTYHFKPRLREIEENKLS